MESNTFQIMIIYQYVMLPSSCELRKNGSPDFLLIKEISERII